MTAVPTHRYVLFFSIAAAGCALDLWTKSWIFGRLGMPGESPPIWLVDHVFSLTTSLNEGALFGVGQGRTSLFGALSVIAALGIFYWLFVARAAHDRLLTVALACVTGGIFGNLYDRLGLPGLRWNWHPQRPVGESVYAVRDWLHFKVEHVIDWPVFNVADSLLVCGAVLLVCHALWSEKPRAQKTAENTATSP